MQIVSRKIVQSREPKLTKNPSRVGLDRITDDHVLSVHEDFHILRYYINWVKTSWTFSTSSTILLSLVTLIFACFYQILSFNETGEIVHYLITYTSTLIIMETLSFE